MDRAIGALDAHVHMQAEGVVAPDDIAEDFVVSAVVRRVDDPLLLPGAPRMRADGAERDVERAGELEQLPPALGHRRRRLGEGLAAARAHLDLGRDQLADEVLFHLGPLRGGLEFFKAVDQAQIGRVEDGELLFDRDREVSTSFERLARGADLLFGTELLGLTHAAKVSEPQSSPSSSA
jgi:hypothetical protein